MPLSLPICEPVRSPPEWGVGVDTSKPGTNSRSGRGPSNRLQALMSSHERTGRSNTRVTSK